MAEKKQQKKQPRQKIANWRCYAGAEACQALNKMRLTDVDLVMMLEKVLDKIQARLNALNKIRLTFNFENAEDQAAWKAELEKEFTPSWEPFEVAALAGAGGSLSVSHLKALRELGVLK